MSSYIILTVDVKHFLCDEYSSIVKTNHNRCKRNCTLVTVILVFSNVIDNNHKTLVFVVSVFGYDAPMLSDFFSDFLFMKLTLVSAWLLG